MQIVYSYGVEIKKEYAPLALRWIFSEGSFYLIPVYAETWEELSEIRKSTKTL